MSKKDNRESGSKSSLVILILGIILMLAFIYSLPSLQDYYRENFKSSDIEQESKEEKTDNTLSATDQYVIKETNEFNFNDLSVSDITYQTNGNFLTSMSLAFSSKEKVDLEKLNYYLEFYSSNNEFITRRILKGKVAKEKVIINIDLTSAGVRENDRMLISHISDDGIPSANINTDSNNKAVMTCIKNNDTYKYAFDFTDNIKGNIEKETIRREVYSTTEEEYTTNRLDLQKRINKYNGIEGLTADMVEDTDHLVFLFEVDYSNSIDLKDINEDYVFGSGTNANVIMFKMEAEGFACNG